MPVPLQSIERSDMGGELAKRQTFAVSANHARHSAAMPRFSISTARPAVLALIGALVIVPGAGWWAAEAGQRGPEPRASLVLSLARAGEAARMEALLPDPGLARPARRAVSDLMVLLSSDAGDVDQALGLMNGVPGSARLFRARLVAVIGGRLYARAMAACGGWQSDVATCRVACDGGFFALRRSGREEAHFRLMLGAKAAASEPEEAKTGVLMSSCERDAGPEVRLVPAGGQSGAEVDLSAD